MVPSHTSSTSSNRYNQFVEQVWKLEDCLHRFAHFAKTAVLPNIGVLSRLEAENGLLIKKSKFVAHNYLFVSSIKTTF